MATNLTGNLNIPDSVCKVKAIHELIVVKTNGTMGSLENIFSPDNVKEVYDVFNGEDGDRGGQQVLQSKLNLLNYSLDFLS